VLPALNDAGVGPDGVDALYFGNVMSGMTENETHLAPQVVSHLGMVGVLCQWFEDACATSSNAFKHAVQAVESGIHDVALIGGVEQCTPETGLGTGEMTRVFTSAAHYQYEQPTGLTFPGVFALLTRHHMEDYGTTERELAEVAVKNHYHGRLNDRVHFGKSTTVETVLDSPIVAEPFHLIDCYPFSDGASAVVVTAPDPPTPTTAKGSRLRAWATAPTSFRWRTRSLYTPPVPPGRPPARRTLRRAKTPTPLTPRRSTTVSPEQR